MIQNLESAHGNNLRVRTLFEQDSELSVVYVVRANTDSADNVIWTQWRFDKINDENIRYTSNVGNKSQLEVEFANLMVEEQTFLCLSCASIEG